MDWFPPEGRPGLVYPEQLRVSASTACLNCNSDFIFTQYGPETDVWQMGATIHSMCRLLKCPDPRVFGVVPGYAPCGRRYDKELNGAARSCLQPDRTMRPTAFEMASYLDSMAAVHGMRQQTMMRR